MPSLISAERNSNPTAEWRVARFVRSLGPYQALVLLLVPVSVVEPLKLVAVAIAGQGHWIAGTAMVTLAYAVSLLVIERLFKLVKPKLLTLRWFARLWKWFVELRGRLANLFAPSAARGPTTEHDRPAVKPERQ